MQKYIIWLAFGSIYDSAGIGLLTVPRDGSLLCLERVLVYLPDPDGIVCSAGHCRSHPQKPTKRLKVSLAQQQIRYLKENRTSLSYIANIGQTLRWGSGPEIISAVEHIKLFRDPEEDSVEIVIASHPIHLRRIKLYVQKYVPPEWNVTLLTADNHFSQYSIWRERLGYPFALARHLPAIIKRKFTTCLPKIQVDPRHAQIKCSTLATQQS